MDSVIRLPSQQSLFNAQNTLVDLIIPGSSGIYDLSQSFVSILTRLSPTKSTVAASAGLIAGSGEDNGIYDVRLHFKHHVGAGLSIYDTTATPIECLVSSCSMMSASKGMVEDIRRSDVLRGTLSAYQKDLDSRQAEALTTWAGAAKDQPWVHGQYVDLYGEGTLRSSEITHEIRIQLKDLFDAGRFDSWDSSVYGDTRIHLELNLGQVQATQCQGLADPTWQASYQRRVVNGASGDLDFANFGYRTARPDPTLPLATKDIGTGTNPNISLTSLTMQTVYDSLEDSPWWVGQDVSIGVVNTGAQTNGLLVTKPFGETLAAGNVTPTAGQLRRAIITSLEFGVAGTGLVTMNFGGPVVVVGLQGGGEGGTLAINVIGSDTAGAALDTAEGKVGNAAPISYEAVELVATMRSDMAPGQAPKEHQYSHFVNQADTFSQQTGIQRTYQIPSNTTAVVIAVTNPGADHSSFLGSATVFDYRFTIDGVQVTNRPVPYREVGNGAFTTLRGGSLHYDLVMKTFLNIGENARYQSLKESVYDQIIPVGQLGNASGGQGFNGTNKDPLKACFLLCCPIPMKEMPSQLLLELGGNFNGGANLQIYSYVTSNI